MPKTGKTPASILKALMDEYQLTAFSLSKAINISNSSILQILNGKGKVTIATALRFQKFFGNPVAFWLDAQREADLAEAKNDAELNEILKGISKVKAPTEKKADKKKGKDATAKKGKEKAPAKKAKEAKKPGRKKADATA